MQPSKMGRVAAVVMSGVLLDLEICLARKESELWPFCQKGDLGQFRFFRF